MKMIITMLTTILSSTVLMAAGPKMAKPVEGGLCSNMAKYGAIKSLKENQGKDGSNISYNGNFDSRAYLTQTEESVLTYSVSVDEDANDGADDFTVHSDFVVKVRALVGQAKKCEVLSVAEVTNP